MRTTTPVPRTSRRKRNRPVILGAVAAGAALAATTVMPPPAAAGNAAAGSVAVQAASSSIGVKTVKYGAHRRQVMDVYTPAKAVGEVGQRLGTVVLVHGGAWVKGDKADLAPQARQLARLGYLVANINYRYATDAAWPAPRTDTRNAVRHLRSNARSLNVDNSRIVLVGSSAGAHLATSVATLGRAKDLVSGVIGLSGPLGMWRTAYDPRGNLDTIVTQVLMRCRPPQCEDRYRAATPKNQLSRGDVPSLLFSSRHEWLNPQNSVDFVRKAQRIGLSSRMVWIPGNLHARYYWDEAWPTIRSWLAKQMAK